MGMLDEIQASGEGWAQAVEAGSACAWPWQNALFLGSGSSYYLARIAAWLARSQGLWAQALPSGEAMLYPHLAAGAERVVGISRSGQTTELLKAVETLGLPAFLLSTRDPGEGGKAFAERVVLDRAREEAIVQTRSFSSGLVFFLTAFLGKEATAHLPRLFVERQGSFGSWPPPGPGPSGTLPWARAPLGAWPRRPPSSSRKPPWSRWRPSIPWSSATGP